MSAPMRPEDPAYWMLQRGLSEEAATPEERNWRSTPTVYDEHCYICRDPEFALMGLPLCYACPVPVYDVVNKQWVPCGAHVPADDVMCNHAHDVQEYHYQQQEGHMPGTDQPAEGEEINPGVGGEDNALRDAKEQELTEALREAARGTEGWDFDGGPTFANGRDDEDDRPDQAADEYQEYMANREPISDATAAGLLGALFGGMDENEDDEVDLTEAQTQAVLIAGAAAKILGDVQGTSSKPFAAAARNGVSADEITSLATWILQAANAIEPRKVEVEFANGLPAELRPFEEKIRERIRQQAASGAPQGVMGFGVPAGANHDDGETETDDDGRVWHYLPAVQMDKGTITKDFVVSGMPHWVDENDPITVEAEITPILEGGKYGKPEERRWPKDSQMRMLCQGCTLQNQLGLR